MLACELRWRVQQRMGEYEPSSSYLQSSCYTFKLSWKGYLYMRSLAIIVRLWQSLAPIVSHRKVAPGLEWILTLTPSS